MFKDIINENINYVYIINLYYKKIEIKKLCLKIKIKNKIKDDKNFLIRGLNWKEKQIKELWPKWKKIIYHEIEVKIK